MKQQILARYRSRRFLSLTLLALMVGGATLTGCRGGGGESKPDAKVSPASATSLAQQVTVVEAKRSAISETIEVTGALNSLSDVIVGVKSSGKLVGVYGREGDTVQKGAVVAQQDPQDL